jgi:hypothetical protein
MHNLRNSQKELILKNLKNIRGMTTTNDLLFFTISKSDNNGSSYYEIARSEWRKHGSGYVLRPAALVSTATSAAAVTRLKVEFHRSFDNTHD